MDNDNLGQDIQLNNKQKLSWMKRINLILMGLVLASGIKVITETWHQEPMPPSGYPELGGDFTLASQTGPVALHDLRGKVVVMFFGYTHCPDICAPTLSNIAAAFRILHQGGELDKTQGLFIALDAERDTAGKTGTFTAHFHPNIIGLSGSPNEISAAAKKFLVGYRKEASDTADSGYTLGHSGYIYILRPDGSVGELLSHTSPPKNIVESVRRWTPWASASHGPE